MLTLLLAIVVGAVLAEGAVLVTRNVYLRRRRRNPLALYVVIHPDGTQVFGAQSETILSVANTLLVKGRGRRARVLRFGERPASSDFAPEENAEWVDLLQGASPARSVDWQWLWVAFLVACCTKASKQIGQPSAFWRVTMRVDTGNESTNRVLFNIAECGQLVGLGDVRLEQS